MEEYPDLRTPETLARLRDVRLSLLALDDDSTAFGFHGTPARDRRAHFTASIRP